ncbi:diguanylate cyclase, partial [Acinetobacter baumannii]
TASVGLAVFPRDGTDSVTLQRHADAAMYTVKARGRNGQERFRPEMTVTGQVLDLEQGLRRALGAGEFELYYQPQVHAVRGVVGVEA